MMRFITRLWRRREGATAVEFAFAAPVVVLFVAGVVEIAMMLFALTLMEAGVRESSRFGITGASGASGVSREQQIRNIVARTTIGLIDMNNLIIQQTIYGNFAQIGQPEPFTDTNGNGTRDGNEPFTDVNGNGQWDPDMGRAGAGGPGDVVVYTLIYDWPLLTGLLTDMIGAAGSIRLRASVAVRNEPYATP
jgi:Flp pilus assembly protein TadG